MVKREERARRMRMRTRVDEDGMDVCKGKLGLMERHMQRVDGPSEGYLLEGGRLVHQIVASKIYDGGRAISLTKTPKTDAHYRLNRKATTRAPEQYLRCDQATSAISACCCCIS